MHIVTLKIEDNIYGHVMFLLKSLDEKDLSITEYKTDENLEHDPYFYERQKQLQQDIKDIESGKVKMLSQEEYEDESKSFFSELKSKYEN